MDQFTPNIFIQESECFGTPCYPIITSFLYMVDRNMMAALEQAPFSTRKCIVLYKEEGPMCSLIGDCHLIFLAVRDNYWCQWVYQFAHEYCHHLINGPLSGEWSKMLWFEETICELSSLYNLYMMKSFCLNNGFAFYEDSVSDYLNNQLNNKGRQTFQLSEDGGWYEVYKEQLAASGYHRDLYNTIAVLLFPLFLENPHLWKLIMHIGDIRVWQSLEDLLNHLQLKADDTYHESFLKMRRIFN